MEHGKKREGWETIVLNGQMYSVQTSIMEEKCQAFEPLDIYCFSLGVWFLPYLAQMLDVTLPCLLFYFTTRYLR